MGDDAGVTTPTTTTTTATDDKGAAGSTDSTTTKPDAATVPAFDPSKVSDEDFGKIFDDPRVFNHSRFKELNDKAKKASDYEAKEQKAREAKLIEEKKFTELLAEKDKTIADLTSKQQTSLTNMRILAEAQKAGAVDTDAVLQLIDRSAVKLNDDGTVTGADEAVKKLLESKPYLKGNGTNTTTIGSPTAPGVDTTTGVKRFKHSQIQQMSPAEYAANEKDIMAAMKAGMIEQDVA